MATKTYMKPKTEDPLNEDAPKETSNYDRMKQDFAADCYLAFQELSGEISERNESIQERDNFIYSNSLEASLDIPIGHDMTPVNWLKRTVEIHKTQFMGRGFQISSTYDTQDITKAGEDQEEAGRLKLENKKAKDYAELRQNAINDIIRDNGGIAMFMNGAESASAVGTFMIKAYYDEEQKKYVLSPIEAVENCYVLWNKDDFRSYDAVAYIYQIGKQSAIRIYGVPEDVQTSVLGQPLTQLSSNTVVSSTTTQPMVTVIEVTGKIPGWASKNGRCKKVAPGNETELNAVIVGNEVMRILDDPKRLPRYYVFPNRRIRRRPWGLSDVSDAAISINLTYIETLSDWRTVSNKVNFPKFKGFNFGNDTQMPKYKSRKVQILPLADGQDIQLLNQGDSNQIDFRAQLDELKEQFVRETGISRVLFDDPSVTLNSNQALLTSMKPTSDIAENKKQLWGPILTEMFDDALRICAMWDVVEKDLVDDTDNWNLKVMWPSVMQKEDPVYQQMLLNRFNAGTLSVQSFMEAQGETKEEIDRIRDEMEDQLTAAILGRQLPALAQAMLAPPDQGPPPPKVSVNLKGDLTPAQEANLALSQGFNDGPFGSTMGPQGNQGLIAQENEDNKGFLEGQYPNQTPVYRDQQGNPAPATQPQAPQGQPTPVNTQANNVPGTGVVSQPGSGATATSPQGALDQVTQNNGG